MSVLRPATPEEVDELLVGAADRFLEAATEVPKSRWLERPDERTWSTSEVIEHVVLANTRMTGVFDTIASSPIEDQHRGLVDEEIPFVFYGGDEPPGVADPTGTWTDIDDALGRFRASIDTLRDRASAVDVDLRTVAAPHFRFGLLDGVQWMLFVFAHTERHRGDFRRLARA